MLIWLILIPVIAAALIGLLRMPGRATATVAAAIMLVLGVAAVLCPAECSACLSTFCGQPLQFSLVTLLSKAMVLLAVLVTFAAVFGMKAPDSNAERSWAISSLLISAGADVNATDSEGESALDKAQDEGKLRAVQVLRAAGAR